MLDALSSDTWSEGPLVSVVMVAYNASRYIAQSIESVLNQTMQSLELVVVDDGSTDGTRTLVMEYSRRDHRVRYIAQHHSGITVARNRACEAARGSFIAVLDADDIAKDRRLELQVQYLTKHDDVGLVAAPVELIDEEGYVLGILQHLSPKADVNIALAQFNCIVHSTVMFRTSLWCQLGGYRDYFQAAEDYDFFLRLSEHMRIALLPDVVCQFRIHAGQITATAIPHVVLCAIAAKAAALARRTGMPEPFCDCRFICRDCLVRAG